MAEPLTPEARQALWWDAWWAEDYSWAGLASKGIGGDGAPNGAKTLQDYWLRDAATGKIRKLAELQFFNEIVTQNNTDGTTTLWHIAHVPLYWRDGSAAKAGWDTHTRKQLADEITARLGAASETAITIKSFKYEIPVGADGRAQLNGSVLCSAPSHPNGAAAKLHLYAKQIYLPAWLVIGQQFGPGVCFVKAFFSGNTNLTEAHFYGYTRFFNATFTGDAIFNDVTFSSDALFDNVTFSGVASFDSATFSDTAYFSNATFSGAASYFKATFSGEAIFARARFEVKNGEKRESGKMNFRHAKFAQLAFFADVTFAQNTLHHSAAFSAATFEQIADFQKSGIYWVAALDEAIFEKSLLLDDPSEDADFDAVIERCKTDGAEGDTTPEVLFKQLEGGARVAKVAMGKARDEIKEQQFYRLQLIARSHQQIPRLEWLFSQGFRLTADYGLSLSRPAWGLVIVLLAFWGAYLGIGFAAIPNRPPVLLCAPFDGAVWRDAFTVSLNRMSPLGGLNDDSQKWLTAMSDAGSPVWAFWARILASLQTLLSLALLFLLGLALRRRFKVE